MSGNKLAETVAAVRKARYDNGTGGDGTFVSGDVAPGRVRKTQATILDDDDGDIDVPDGTDGEDR